MNFIEVSKEKFNKENHYYFDYKDFKCTKKNDLISLRCIKHDYNFSIKFNNHMDNKFGGCYFCQHSNRDNFEYKNSIIDENKLEKYLNSKDDDNKKYYNKIYIMEKLTNIYNDKIKKININDEKFKTINLLKSQKIIKKDGYNYDFDKNNLIITCIKHNYIISNHKLHITNNIHCGCIYCKYDINLDIENLIKDEKINNDFEKCFINTNLIKELEDNIIEKIKNNFIDKKRRIDDNGSEKSKRQKYTIRDPKGIESEDETIKESCLLDQPMEYDDPVLRNILDDLIEKTVKKLDIK